MEKLASTVPVSAIVTTLQPPYSDQIRELWQEFAQACKTQFVLTHDPIPHFSWQAAEGYDEAALDQAIQEIARETPSFIIQTSGIGLFTGKMVVVYIAIVKTDQLITLHDRIWETTRHLGHSLNQNYQPDFWVPHITLAYDPLDDLVLDCVLNKIIQRRFSWDLPVDNLGVIHAGKGAELRNASVYKLAGKTGSM
jgi:2'-5' RNA ligase